MIKKAILHLLFGVLTTAKDVIVETSAPAARIRAKLGNNTFTHMYVCPPLSWFDYVCWLIGKIVVFLTILMIVVTICFYDRYCNPNSRRNRRRRGAA